MKEIDINTLQEELRTNRNRSYIFLILMLIGVIATAYAFIQLNQAKKLIEEKNVQLEENEKNLKEKNEELKALSESFYQEKQANNTYTEKRKTD